MRRFSHGTLQCYLEQRVGAVLWRLTPLALLRLRLRLLHAAAVATAAGAGHLSPARGSKPWG
jgi:hypothetical protein